MLEVRIAAIQKKSNPDRSSRCYNKKIRRSDSLSISLSYHASCERARRLDRLSMIAEQQKLARLKSQGQCTDYEALTYGSQISYGSTARTPKRLPLAAYRCVLWFCSPSTQRLLHPHVRTCHYSLCLILENALTDKKLLAQRHRASAKDQVRKGPTSRQHPHNMKVEPRFTQFLLAPARVASKSIIRFERERVSTTFIYRPRCKRCISNEP